jgi:hypothetical protein
MLPGEASRDPPAEKLSNITLSEDYFFISGLSLEVQSATQVHII